MAIMFYYCHLVSSVILRTRMEFAGTTFSILQGCIDEKGKTIIVIERDSYQKMLFKHPTTPNP